MSVVEREGYRFHQRICVPCYETDASFYLKPASFMDMAQEIAYWAAQELGFGYDDLQRHKTAWVLSRMHFHFIAPPKWREMVDLFTWHKGAEGLFYLRDFVLRSPEGEPLVTATSSWLVINVETRHIVWDEETLSLLDVDRERVDDAIVEPAPKVMIPKQLTPDPAGERQVRYSDIDILGHTNNARYLVWAMDALPYQEMASRRVRDVYINFNKETVPGDWVEIFTARESGEEGSDVFYVEGKVEGKSAFTVKLVY